MSLQDGMDSDDGPIDERDLYAPDGGDGPDEDHPHLTEYQMQRLQDFINDVGEIWSGGDDDILDTPEAYAASGMEAAEKRIFDFVDLLVSKRDARIKELESRAAIAEGRVAFFVSSIQDALKLDLEPSGAYEILSAALTVHEYNAID